MKFYYFTDGVGPGVLALHPRVVAAVWAAVEGRLPPRPVDDHPLGCHRPRIADRVCFTGILVRLVTGCSWETAGRLVGVGETTLRRRRDEWITAGVFDRLYDEALAAYDRVLGLDLSEVSIDGSLHKAPCGGEGSGPNPTDRGKLGWKWSLATDRWGIPIGWATDGANRHDIRLLEPTLDAIHARGLQCHEIDTLHLDRGYDATSVRDLCADRDLEDLVIAKRRKRQDDPPRKVNPTGNDNGAKQSLGLGLRWAVERSNSWFSQLRATTKKYRPAHRPPTRPDRARRRAHPHRQTHQMGSALESPATHLTTHGADLVALAEPPPRNPCATTLPPAIAHAFHGLHIGPPLTLPTAWPARLCLLTTATFQDRTAPIGARP